MPLLGIGKKKKAVDSAAETAPANVTSPPPTEAKPVPSVRKKKTKESSAKSKDVNNTPTANPKAAVTKKNKPKKTKKGSKDTTTATASSGQKGPPKKNTTAKKPPLTSSCEAPMGKFQEQDWKTDIEDEQMGNMDDAALSSPSKADLEDDIDEDDWDTESDDTDDERMKHTPPTSKQSPRLHDVAVGAAVGAATIGAAAVGLPAIATDDDDDEEEEDDDDDDDDDEYKRHEEYDKTNQETKEDNIMEDEGDNESTASYESNDSYETENDDSNRTQNQAAFMSPATVQKQTAMSTPFSPLPSTTHHVLETNSIPFFGREKEMKQLDQVRERVTGKRVIDGIKVLENKPEVVLVSGSELGVGTSYFIKEAFYSPSRQTSPDSVYGKCISCRGICEANAGLSSAPLQVFSDLLNDLVVKLILPGRTGGKVIWKDRMNEALGGEGPLLATLVPKIGVLMDLPGFGNDPREIRPPLSGPTTSQTKNSPDKNQPIQNQQQLPPNPRVQFITQWDWNTPRRFLRLCLAVRDLIQAVAQYLPVVMIIDNLQALDQDSWSMLYTIIKSQTLTNFLFVGVHDENTRGKGPEKPSPDHPDPPIWQFEQSLLRDVRSSRLKSKQNDGTAPDEKLVASAEEMEEYLDSEIPKMPEVTKIHLLPFSKVETRKIVGAILADEDPSKAEKAQLLSKVLYSWTHGNALCLIQTLRLLNDQGLLKTGQLKEGWDWNEKSIEQRIEEWKTTIRNGQSHKEIRIVVTARINALPAKVKFVVVTTAALQQTYFSSRHLFRVLKAAHPNNKGLSKENSKIKNKNEEFPISSSKELESVLQHACDFGLIKRLSKEQSFAFAHDIIQDCAYALLPKKAKGFGEKSTNPAARKDWQIHCRMGTEYSVLAMMKELPIEERDRYKFLAADQLVISQKVIWDDRNSIAKLLLETAELCVIRSAFASSTVYLETGINLLDKEEQFSTDNAVTCFRMYLWLAKMRLACGNIPGAKDACQLLLDQAKTLKDKVPVVQVYIQILLVEGSRQKALEEALSYLEQMGESFPKAGVADAIDRELDQLRKTVQGKENNALLRPKRITDKKTLDVLVLLANVLEISRLSRKRAVQELAMIRMMNLSLQAGFSRQYPMAFAYFSTTLVQRGIKANDAEMVKEAHRMGQVCEKMARLSDFYGGFSVALFHWHVSHWKRLYKRTLEPVLRVYNAQLDSGDFFHVEFSIFTYMNLHLASGYSLDKLNDNVQLFFGLYQDYSLSNKWRIDFPRIFVSNMLGESEKPLIFFGETVEEEGRKIAELEQANETEALEYLNFLRLYMAVFFHENDMAEECLAKLSDDIDGIWIPWVLFFQCFVAISKVPAKKGPGRKKLLESIEEIKEQLIVWYNDFHAPNPNAMVSLLEAELMMVKNVGRKEFPSIKIQLAFEEAISAARNDEMNHLEAFCCERAALHFEAAKLDGYVAEYMRKAYALYDQWNALAKIIDIEKKYAKLLKLSKQRTRPMATQPVASDIAANGERTIGGGRGAIRPVDIKKTLKKGAKNTRREIKALFGIHRATENSSNGTKESPPCSPESKNSPIKSPKRLPPPKSSPFTRKQKPAKVRTSDMDEDIREKSFTTNDQSSSEAPSSSSKKSPGSLKSPRFAKPKLKLPFGGGKKAKNSKNSSDCDESDGSDDS